MSILFLAAAVSLLAIGQCNKNFTVTSEVVFDLEVKNYNGNGDDISGKLVIGLFGETAAVSALNFKTLCEGYKAPSKAKVSFKNTYCHRLVRDMLVQCGDVFGLDGKGSTSIYGEHFNDENFIISYSSGGIVGYANKGRDTNGSQFFITLGASRFFDNKHVGFGKVLKGYQYMQAINRMGSQDKNQTPKRPIRFTDCTVNEVKKYELTEKDMKTDDLEGIVVM